MNDAAGAASTYTTGTDGQLRAIDCNGFQPDSGGSPPGVQPDKAAEITRLNAELAQLGRQALAKLERILELLEEK